MYSDKAKKRRGWLMPALLLLLAALLLFLLLSRTSGGELKQESAEAIRAAVSRSALQCYAVEGMYPPSLAYLEENYGLQVNTQDFYVRYEAFASNLPPVVRVIAKG